LERPEGERPPRVEPPRRRHRGPAKRAAEPQGLGSVLEDLFRQRPWRPGMTLGQLARRWSLVVGERLAQESAPVSLEGGTLVVRASSSAWAAQLRFLRAEVVDGANRAIGAGSVRQLSVVVDRNG
jgi:predicted nucleic acid-binding Zn ribbon protein